MAANWTKSQVFTQLNTGYKWSGATIAYAFPTATSAIHGTDSDREYPGFRAIDPNSTQATQIRLALQNWDDLIPQTFQETTATTSNLEFGNSSSMDGYAHAYYPKNGSTWFSTKYTGSNNLTDPTIGAHGFVTIQHEIGHALGLNHMGNYNAGDGKPVTPSSYQDSTVFSIMSYFGPSGPYTSQEVAGAIWKDYQPQTPMLNDVMAIQSIYGKSSTTRTDDTVYGFSSSLSDSSSRIYNFTINQNPILTIFDSAGNDTLNVSGWNTNANISLEDGGYSSCNGMTNNIAIAYGSQIENAVSGGGNDVLTGNAAANRLVGGDGNDTLNGGGGADELTGGTGEDTLIGGAGDDAITGGDGTDTVEYSGAFSSYKITSGEGRLIIANAADGADAVSGVEVFRFSDGTKLLNQLFPTDDKSAPILSILAPADDETGVLPGANLVLTFNESVQLGTGTIKIIGSSGATKEISVGDTAQATLSGNTVTINPTADLLPKSGYYVNISPGAFKDLAGNNFAGITGSTAYNFTTGESIAPVLLGSTPADDASDVAPAANFVLNFSETVKAATGTFIIYQADGTIFRSMAMSDTSQITISGNTVTVNPAADLAYGTNYYINITSGALKDVLGNNYGGISGTTAFSFSTSTQSGDDYSFDTKTTGVVATDGSATGGTIEVANDRDMFKVSLTSGVTYEFNLARTTSGLSDPFLQLFNAPSSSQLALLAADNNSGGSNNSRIIYKATASGAYYLGVRDYGSGTGGYQLTATATDTTGPVITNMSPADNASNVSPGADFVLTFNESIQAGVGNFVIRNDNGSIARSIAVTDTSQVSISGSTVTINPSDDLGYGRNYYIEAVSGVLRDLNGNNFAGLTGSRAYNFSTGAQSDDYPFDSSTNGVVTVNGSATGGTIEIPGDMDMLKVTLEGGKNYVFSLTPSGQLSDPYLVLYTKAKELFGYQDDTGSARINFTTSESGTYYLGVADAGVGTGSYSVSAVSSLDDYQSTNLTSGVVVVNGSAIAGTIEISGDEDMFKVSLKTGTTYVFNLNAAALANDGGLSDPSLQLFDAKLKLVSANDDFGDSLNSQITYRPSVSGTYYLKAQNSSTDDQPNSTYKGTYTLSAASTGTAGSDKLIGTDADNTFYGFGGDDILDGKTGNDTLVGGQGNDTYVVDSLLDIVTELAVPGSGNDTIITSLASYTLGANLENLGYTGTLDFTGIGNELNNKLIGGKGNDYLDGGAGSDSMKAGLGNDIYIVDNAGDRVIELAKEGTDLIRTSLTVCNMALIGANVENIEYVGSATIEDFIGTGNAGNNTITGNAGNDTLRGGSGDDTLDGAGGGDILMGEGGNDILIFDGADSKIDGGTGIDTLKISGSDITLDLSQPIDGVITGIEKVDLTGSGNNRLLVNVENLKNLTGALGKNLFVTGDAGDSVTITKSMWTDANHKVIDGVSYHQFTHLTGGTTDHLYVLDTLTQQVV